MSYQTDIAEARRRAIAYQARIQNLRQVKEDEDDRRMYVILYAAVAIGTVSLATLFYFLCAA